MKKFTESIEPKNELEEVFNNMIGKDISLIDSTNYLIRVSGIMSMKNGMIELKKDYNKVSIMIDSIVSYRELTSNNETKKFRFKLHNGHYFDLVY